MTSAKRAKMEYYGLIAAFVLCGIGMFAAMYLTNCGGDDAGTPVTPAAQTVTYSGIADGETYTLKITQNTNRAAFTPQGGDSYELTVGSKKSAGTVVSFTSGTFTLQPSVAVTAIFYVTVDSTGITNITAAITFTDGTSKEAPGTVTPVPPSTGNTNTSLNGTWVNIGDLFGESYTYKMVLSNGIFIQYLNNVEDIKGTYSTSGNNITITTTHVKGTSDLGLSPTQWYTKEQYKPALLAAGNTQDSLAVAFADMAFTPLTGTYTLTSNTLTTIFGEEGETINTTTYTRQ